MAYINKGVAMMEQIKNVKKYSNEEIKKEYRAWARFLYKQYRKDKFKKELLKKKGTK